MDRVIITTLIATSLLISAALATGAVQLDPVEISHAGYGLPVPSPIAESAKTGPVTHATAQEVRHNK